MKSEFKIWGFHLDTLMVAEVVPHLGLRVWNRFEESGPEWKKPKKPLIEEYTFAHPREVSIQGGFCQQKHRHINADSKIGPGG